jgi:tetratricopeptide (TPR) repeat protein
MQMEQVGLSVPEFNAMLPHGVGAATSEAYDDFLQGSIYTFSWTKDGIAKGRELERKAIALDPNYGFAYVMLGNTYVVDILQQWNQDGDLERASQAAQKAIAVADTNLCAFCGYALASTVAYLKAQYDRALTYAERAIEFDPNLSVAYLSLANALIAEDRAEEGLAALQKAMRRDPLNRDGYLVTVAYGYTMEGRYSEAIPVLERYISRFPHVIVAHEFLAIDFAELDQIPQARAQLAEILRINPQYSLDRVPPWLTHMKDQALLRRWALDLKKSGFKVTI